MYDWQETVTFYRKQGAPGDQTALVNLLREIQDAHGHAIPGGLLPDLADALGTKESFLRAVIQRMPSLRLSGQHVLELCGGPNCSNRAQLAQFVEETYGKAPAGFLWRHAPCMRLCGKGPNIKWDGKIYHQADAQLLRRLIEESEK